MANLGSLSVFLTANTTPFQRKMKQSAKSMGALKTGAMALGGALAGAFAIGRIKAVISEMATLGDNIGKASKRIGIGSDEYQKLSFAAERAGATTTDVERAFKRMSSTIFDAGKGLKESKDALEFLGLSFKKLDGLKPDKQFQLIADRLNLVEDATNKAALAQDIFGRAGTALIPMIENYKELGDELERTGRIISEKNIKAAEAYKDSLTNIEKSWQNIIFETGVLQWLADVADSIDTVLGDTNKWNHLLESYAEHMTRIATLGIWDTEAKKVKIYHNAITDAEVAAKAASVNARRRAIGDTRKATAEMKKQIAEREKMKKAEKDLGVHIVPHDLKEMEAFQKQLEKQDNMFKERVKMINKEITLAKLRRAGMEKEAFIMERMAGFGKDLTEAQRKQARKLVERLFEERKEAEEKDEVPTGPRLSEAIRAGTQAAFSLRTAGFGTDADNKLRIKNTKANIAAAVELRKQNRDGIKVTGIRTVDNVDKG